MSEYRLLFSEPVRFKAEPGLNRAVAEAARRNRTSGAEWMRRALRDRLATDGVALPPIGPDDGPGPAAPALARAA